MKKPMPELIHRRVATEGGDLVIETVSEVGPMTHTDRWTFGLSREDARCVALGLMEHFNLVNQAPKLLPRKVFDALPPAQKSDVIARGFQLYDYEEDLDDDALIYDVRLRPNA